MKLFVKDSSEWFGIYKPSLPAGRQAFSRFLHYMVVAPNAKHSLNTTNKYYLSEVIGAKPESIRLVCCRLLLPYKHKNK